MASAANLKLEETDYGGINGAPRFIVHRKGTNPHDIPVFAKFGVLSSAFVSARTTGSFLTSLAKCKR